MADNEKEYLLGASEAEIRRLEFQNEVWKKATGELWQKAGIKPGERIVDLGCGPGLCTFPLAELVGAEGHVLAVDSSAKFASLLTGKIRETNSPNISFHRNFADELEFEDECADAVFARWLFCFLEKPETAVSEIRRILKPGGRIIIMDYFNYLAANIFPRNEALSALFRAYLQINADHQGSYNIGEVLPKLLVERNFGIESLTPICRTVRPGSDVWRWVETFNEVSVPVLVEQGIWSAEQKDRFETEWEKTSNDPASFFFTPPMIGIIARKTV